MNSNVRILIASFLSLFVLIMWQYFFAPEQLPVSNNSPEISANVKNSEVVPIMDAKSQFKPRTEILDTGYEKGKRVQIRNNYINGSINLVGARIDDMVLLKYKQTIDKDSKDVVLLSPSYTEKVYFSQFGWISSNKNLELPGIDTIWEANKEELTPNNEVTLKWSNKNGVLFEIKFTLNDNYMFNVEQRVSNLPQKEKIQVNSYALLSRAEGDSKSDFMIHEGGIGAFDNKLHEISYKDIRKKGVIKYTANNGWIGFSDKYWLVTLIPENTKTIDAKLMKFNTDLGERYQADVVLDLKKEGNSLVSNYKLFAGAKKIGLLDQYEKKYNIELFDRTVDFGMLYFITKPIFITLNYFHSIVGNFGVAILLLTVLIKILLFPLAFKGFKGMNKLKDLQPKMTKLKEVYADDPSGFQKALVGLYKTEKVNPMSGCLPLLLQMPIFFALYKVLYVTIEMRHAPFFGWIKNLSAPDPTTIFNLFGLIPWQPPSFLMIGVLPILMALTLFLQQRLNPQPADPMQAKVMKMIPLIFVFMFASFPSGLVLYWTWSNILSIIQQVFIKRLSKK